MYLDSIHEECGVFGIFDPDKELDVAHITYTAMYALQHRGQESCGMVVNNSGLLFDHKDMGLTNDVFNEMVLRFLKGNSAIAHLRYPSARTKGRENTLPLLVKYPKGQIAFCHNGNIVNADELKESLTESGATFETTSDCEIIAKVVQRERIKTKSTERAVINAMDHLVGAYSLLALGTTKLIAARDPKGFRPLCVGKLGNATVVASESCAIDAIGGEFIRDILPGEVLVVTKNGMESYKDKCGSPTSLCIFEHIYFARPDSVIDGMSVHYARRNAGKYLAKEHAVEADLVAGVPDSGLDAALGYAEESGIPYGLALVKNRYIGRTFIQTTQWQRENSVRIKLNVLSSAVKGKRVVLVDDSIVRGTTSAKLVSLLREAGATEVHMRISSPPFLYPCHFGTDISSQDNLIACKMTVDEICKELGADSLGYLSTNALKYIAADSGCDFCTACFTGKYPVEVPHNYEKIDENAFAVTAFLKDDQAKG